MRAALFSLLLVGPFLSPLAQTSPEALQSVVILNAPEADRAMVALSPEAVERLSGEVSATNTVLTVLAATGAYVAGGYVGYMLADAIADDRDDLGISGTGLYFGIAAGGTLASGIAAHLVSNPNDPAWRTILVPLAVQSLVFGGAELFLANPNGTQILGAPPVAITVSTSIALWD